MLNLISRAAALWSPRPVRGERVRVRGRSWRARRVRPLTPALSPITGRGGSVLIALALVLMLVPSLARAAEVQSKIDWPQFLSRHDLLYTKVPTKWAEAPFTGNGLLGAIVYLTDDGTGLRFRVNRTDVWVYQSQAFRVPIGDMVLRPVGKITGGEFRLDLWNAELTGTLKTDKGEIGIRSFTHTKDLVQVIEIKPTAGEVECKWEFQPGICANPRTIRNKEPIPENEKNPDPIVSREGEANTVLQKVRTGDEYATAWREVKSDGGGSRTLYLSIGFIKARDGESAAGQAIGDIDRAAKTGIQGLAQTHRDWWHNFYAASFLSVPDTRLESFYWIQLYKLASATRADRPAIDLMGPWFNETPWPRYWWNLNIQLTYYPVYPANHLELGESLCKLIDDHVENLSKNAKEFSEDSESIARSTGMDCRGGAGNELCNYPWAIWNYYMQYRYSMDDAMLRDRLLPRMKRAMNFYFHNMTEAEDGKLHITRGFSPEYPKQPTPNPDCNIDLALVRWGCQALIDSCNRLKIDDPDVGKWKNALEKLTPYPTDENGLKVSASVPFAESHRHYSHLLMIYPLYVMNPDQPENRDLVIKSVDHWMGMPAALRGYSYTGASSISASLGRGDEAVKYLKMFVDGGGNGRYPALPNTMYLEAGPVIETPLSAARSLQDIVIQSWGGTIRVFPGVPDEWKDVTIDKMRTEGAFLVSASKRGGKTQWVVIKSLAGEPCRVKTDMRNVVADANVPIKQLENGVVEVDLKKDESVVLHPADQKPDVVVAPVDAQPERVNTFGVH
jgi:alpha-L-fucosidase 2